jgi:phosphatidylserine/phosphatidylglycerophosphate/cardiolipin synthase-like enzyme
MSSKALAEQAVLQVRFGEVVEGILDDVFPDEGASLQPVALTDVQMASATEATTAALNRLVLQPRQAGLLRDTALSHVADRFVEGDVARGGAHLRVAAAILGAIEHAFFQPPSLKDFLFFPSEACRDRLLSYLRKASVSIEVAIFSLTDDRICDALIAAHRRGVKVRVISDNETALNEGSDVIKLAEAGVATVVDCDLAPSAKGGSKGHSQQGARSQRQEDAGADGGIKRHMHNKFVICDSHLLLTGSFNFTYAASSKNYENLMATDDSFFVQRYSAEFEKLWRSFWGSTYEDTKTRQQAVVTLQAIHRGRKARKSIVARRSLVLGMESFPALGT